MIHNDVEAMPAEIGMGRGRAPTFGAPATGIATQTVAEER
jgi:hypothetical protein